MVLGARIHVALLDLAFTIDPRLVSGDTRGRRIRPWLGLLIVALLALGLVAAGDIGFALVREVAPHRETRP